MKIENAYLDCLDLNIVPHYFSKYLSDIGRVGMWIENQIYSVEHSYQADGQTQVTSQSREIFWAFDDIGTSSLGYNIRLDGL